MSGEVSALPAIRRFRVNPVIGKLLSHRLFVTGATLLGVVIILSIAAGVFAPYGPLQSDFRHRLAAPSMLHLFGTDNFGRDVLSRTLFGGRTSLTVGVSVVITTTVAGTLAGTLAGYFRRLDNPLMRVFDALMAFPGVFLAIALAAVLGPSLMDVIIALTVTYTPRTARIVRSAVLVVRNAEYVAAARLAGASDTRIILRHILPNSLPPLIVQMTYIFAVSILAEAVLSFVGVGPPPPTPSWGNIIADGRNYVPTAPWISLFPGIVIALCVLGINLLGDGLRDVLDPRVKAERA